MKLYRYMLAAVAALVFTAPAFAAEDAAANLASNDTTMQATDNAATTANTTQQATDQSEAAAKINLNQASTKDLMKIKGINASKAKAIVAYRKKHGDFKSVNDLSKVSGFTHMKADTMTKITDQVSVN